MKKLNEKQIKKISKPWISNYITKLISHRERLFNKKKRNPPSIEIKRAYTLFRITREITKAKKEYYKNYFQVNMNYMKNLWKGIKNILNINNKGDLNISQLSLDGKTITGNNRGTAYLWFKSYLSNRKQFLSKWCGFCHQNYFWRSTSRISSWPTAMES